MVKVIQNKKNIYRFLILVGLLFPVSNAFADGNITDFSITVNPSLSLSVSSSTVGFEITPTQAGVYNSASFNVYSSTNNATGYTLTMSTNKVDLESNTVNPNTGTKPTIPTLTETQNGITAAAFEASTDSTVLNHYGVSIAGANYNAMKSEKEIKKTTENNTTQDTTTIALASKLDLLTVPGVYSTTFNFQMTANFVPVSLENAYAGAGKTKATIGGQQYYAMQDMSSAICNAVNVDDDELQVYDNRDNKIYWVAKLKDGHCWMTQNLDLDLVHMANDADALYTHANTDLGWGSDTTTNSWNPERSTIPSTNISSGTIVNWEDDHYNPYSVDTGDWYWTDTWYYSGDCWDSNTSSALCNYLTGDTVGKFRQTQYLGNGTHGHVGNYYNWTAAIASNNSSSFNSSTYADISGNPQNSLCPAGWRLPMISNASDTTGSTNEFKRLTTLYGNNTNNDTDLVDSPLYFVRGGYIYDGSLVSSGYEGLYWSSTVSLIPRAYFLTFDSGYVSLDEYYGRGNGYTVRCVAR